MNEEKMDLNLSSLAAEIESVRAEMAVLIHSLGEIQAEVVDISQKLDMLILRYMTLKRAHGRGVP